MCIRDRNDNFYTNSMAKAHLLRAVEIFKKLEAQNPNELANLCNEISLSDEEVEIWQNAATKMTLLYDDALGINAQDENFLNRAHFDFEEAKDKHPLLLNYHPLTLYRYQICKQADVVLADILCPQNNIEIATSNFDYYEAITSHDSTLSVSYTHLDVYKRQSKAFAFALIGIAANMANIEDTRRINLLPKYDIKLTYNFNVRLLTYLSPIINPFLGYD